MVQTTQNPPQQPLQPAKLTHREQEVLRCLMAGLPNKRIARKLNISDSTVKTHLSNIMQKLDAHNRTEVTFKARELGLFD